LRSWTTATSGSTIPAPRNVVPQGTPLRTSLSLLLLAGLLPAAYAAPPATVTPGIDFSHEDWTLACDNTRTCRAAGYQRDDGDSEPVSILLTRLGGPDQPVTAELMLGQYDETTLPRQLRLQINDAALGKLAYDAGAGTAEFSAAQVAALLASLSRSSRVVVVGDDGKRWTVSDRGASAVLLKMDEFQGHARRIGAQGNTRRSLGTACAARPGDRAGPNRGAPSRRPGAGRFARPACGTGGVHFG
jgi:hypothetical protein